MNATELARRRDDYRRLHESGCFVIPNPWDIGTARLLRSLRFQALATTSAGLAFSLGRPDADWAIPLDVVLAHISGIVEHAGVPVSADFESGYADDAQGLAANVQRCIDTGVAGLSIEDRFSGEGHGLYALDQAVARIRAVREAIDKSGSGVLLTARTECYLTGHPQARTEALRRLAAFAGAGADVLFAPGVRDVAEIREIVDTVWPKPVNVLMGSNLGLSVADLAANGVRRISLGSALCRVALSAFLHAAEAIAGQGSFEGLDHARSFAELNAFFLRDWNTREA